MDSGATYQDFLMEHLDFAIEYASMHYPFTEQEILAHWDVLVKGDAYYPIYIQDCEQVITPALGLSYNKNIQWSEKLASCWKVGWWNPFVGQYEGLGEFPFDVLTWLKLLDEATHQQASSLYQGEEYIQVASSLPTGLQRMKEYPMLNCAEIAELYLADRVTVLVNPSIWSNTLNGILTPETVNALIDQKRGLLKQADEVATKELADLGLSLDFEIAYPEPKASNYNPNIPLSESLIQTMKDLGFIPDDENEG